MQLNSDQITALQHGQPVPLVIENTECVVIKREVYEQSLATSEWTSEEMDILAAEAADRLDTAEPIQ